MSFTFDPALLESITQEARQCFLEEDAPGYLHALNQGVQQILSAQQPDYKAMMRAAHSIKGGAGVAQLPELSKLAHKLEDLLECLADRTIPADTPHVHDLLQRGITELAYLFSQVVTTSDLTSDLTADPDLLAALDAVRNAQGNHRQPHLVDTASDHQSHVATGAPELSAIAPAKVKLIKAALETDLQSCLSTIASLVQSNATESQLVKGLTNFAEECTLLGEAFNLPWLVSAVESLTDITSQSLTAADLRQLGDLVIAQVRRQSATYLAQLDLSPPAPRPPSSPVRKLPSQDFIPPTKDEVLSLDSPNFAPSQLRIPLRRLEQMGSAVEELLIHHERLTLQQQQLKQASQTLRRLVEQVKPMRDQVQALYDQVGTTTIADNPNPEFDVLEMDRYTTLHSSLQAFEELITQIQEARVDIDLVGRELGQDLEQVRLDLNQLYENITKSRLVSFQTFAQRFLPQVRRLSQRVNKTVELHIAGDVLVDRVLLEQLQTPITHLLNNAIDHGIESTEDRFIFDKPSTAQIELRAHTEGTEVVITCKDDGRGIDLAAVYQRAVQRGLCSPNLPMQQLRREDILDFIFQPGFSTASTVSDISGRGVGLDIVRTQVQQLRGQVSVDTRPGQGTNFTIRLPLSLNLVSLVLCQAQQRMVAIPTDSVLEILPYADMLEIAGVDPSQAPFPPQSLSTINWRGQTIPLVPLMTLLPYQNLAVSAITPRVGIILKVTESYLAVTVDTIVDERQLILKSFDNTVPLPPYVAGCTILGTGEAVPVLLPQYFKPLLHKLQSAKGLTEPPVHSDRTILIAEDSTGARRSLERILTQAGFAVIPCRDGQEALDTLQQRQSGIDLVISDVEMPRMDGFDLLQRIRTHTYWHSLPVVMLTSRTGDRHRQKAVSLGASGYLGKPITPNELLTSITPLIMSAP